MVLEHRGIRLHDVCGWNSVLHYLFCSSTPTRFLSESLRDFDTCITTNSNPPDCALYLTPQNPLGVARLVRVCVWC